MALPIDRLVPRGRVEHPLLGWGMDGASLCSQIGAQFGRDIPPIEGDIGGWDPGQKWTDIAQVRVLAGAVNDVQNTAEAVGAGMDLGADPAARAAQ